MSCTADVVNRRLVGAPVDLVTGVSIDFAGTTATPARVASHGSVRAHGNGDIVGEMPVSTWLVFETAADPEARLTSFTTDESAARLGHDTGNRLTSLTNDERTTVAIDPGTVHEIRQQGKTAGGRNLGRLQGLQHMTYELDGLDEARIGAEPIIIASFLAIPGAAPSCLDSRK